MSVPSGIRSGNRPGTHAGTLAGTRARSTSGARFFARPIVGHYHARSGPAARAFTACALLLLACALACGGSGSQARLDDARALQDAGSFAESIEPLREVLAEQPDLPEANYRLGVALVQTGQASLAVWPLEKAMKTEEFEVPAGLLLASAFLAMKAHEDAARVASQVLEADPERDAALRIRAQAYLMSGEPEPALADARRLVELLPEDYQASMLEGSMLLKLGRLDEAEEVFARLKELGVASGEPAQAAQGCLAYAHFFAEGREDPARAEKEYAACLETYPTEPLALQLGAQFYDSVGRTDAGTTLWREAVREAPENLSFRVMLAERVAAGSEPDEARAILEEAAESFGTPGAWQTLAEFERRHDDPEAAAEAMGRAVELSGGADEALRFSQGDLYVETDRIDDARAVMEGLTEPTYKELLRGRILMAEGDAAGALQAFDAGLRRWPNNPGARYLAGLAARESGDVERAMSELREAARIDAAATEAALALASLHLDRGEWEDASEFAQMYVANHPTPDLRAFVVAARAAVGAGEYESGRATLDEMAKLPGSAASVALERAHLERQAQGPAAAAQAVEESGVDLTLGEHEELLRSLVEDLIALGRSEEALARVSRARTARPGDASLAQLEGAVLARAGRTDEAAARFEEAIALSPDETRAQTSLATLEAARGELDAALARLDAAIAAAPQDPAPYYLAGQILLSQGRNAAAEERFRAVVARSPGHAGARNDLAWLLASEDRELDLALELAREARRLAPSADVIDTLGFVQLKRGDAEAAVALFEEALALRPDDPSLRYHLGLALARAGDREQAMAAFQRAIDAGPFPEAEAARQEIARLQQPQG